MAIATNLGFPRMGPRRELKRLLEGYWQRTRGATEMLEGAKALKEQAWKWQTEAGINHVPVGDFSLYDHVLDWAERVGAIPPAYQSPKLVSRIERYFAMARGTQDAAHLPALEMTKWFNTNYHYIVPEWSLDQAFHLDAAPFLQDVQSAQQHAEGARPVVLGPVSLLWLGKMAGSEARSIDLLDRLLPVYEQLLDQLEQVGCQWVQWDEPILAIDLDEPHRRALQLSLERLTSGRRIKLLLTSYFESLGDHLPWAFSLPVAGVHLDLVSDPAQLPQALAHLRDDQHLSLGLVDGRNVWRTDLNRAIGLAEQGAGAVGGERLLIAPSCSLLHCPVDLSSETRLDAEVRPWLAFARQKLDEIFTITQAVNQGRFSVDDKLRENAEALQARRASSQTTNPQVRQRVGQIDPGMYRRPSRYAVRQSQQRSRLKLPLLPTTTIGSFPQTGEIRRKRAAFRQGDLSADAYHEFLKAETAACIAAQEEIGLDVLVHGEFERNDMVEYFGQQLQGFVVTRHGWVQSYGSRCVKPPILYGDVQRTAPLTVPMTQFAQSLTERPVKGMLTGPVTILNWSFVRDDQPREATCRQIALAIRDEVSELEAAGIHVIQIDEPALREGLPLRREDQPSYLAWAVDAFRLATSVVRDETQIHTHMCYCDFNDILPSIAALDADVISLETSRSKMELLKAFSQFQYPNEIGPGVYDIHSPRIPTIDEMVDLLHRAAEVIPPERLWVNPDCGLKTRRWTEVEAALKAMVEAARQAREQLCLSPAR